MRRYKLILTLEYFFSEADKFEESDLQRIIENKSREMLDSIDLGKKEYNDNVHIVKAHLDRLPF